MGSGAGVQPQAGREAEDRRRGTLPLLCYAQFLPVSQPFSGRKTFPKKSSQEGRRVLRGNCCAASGCPPPAGAAGSPLPRRSGAPPGSPPAAGLLSRGCGSTAQRGGRRPAPLAAAMYSPRRHPWLLTPDLFVFFLLPAAAGCQRQGADRTCSSRGAAPSGRFPAAPTRHLSLHPASDGCPPCPGPAESRRWHPKKHDFTPALHAAPEHPAPLQPACVGPVAAPATAPSPACGGTAPATEPRTHPAFYPAVVASRDCIF